MEDFFQSKNMCNWIERLYHLNIPPILFSVSCYKLVLSDDTTNNDSA